jgi:hypothetical protein
MMRTLSTALFSLLVACQAGPQDPYQPFTAMQPVPQQPMQSVQPQARVYNIRINGRALTDADRQTIARLEQQSGRPAVDGDYWYDNATGVLGQWNGPGIAMLPAGLGLGGALPANASGGGSGQLTGVFLNGRELHPNDYRVLSHLVGQPIQPGRYWADAQGYAGPEGGPAVVNFAQLAAQQQRRGGNSRYTSDGRGQNTFVSEGCTAVNGKTGSGETESKYSYYIGCE